MTVWKDPLQRILDLPFWQTMEMYNTQWVAVISTGNDLPVAMQSIAGGCEGGAAMQRIIWLFERDEFGQVCPDRSKPAPYLIMA
jgi:hypothetical protein